MHSEKNDSIIEESKPLVDGEPEIVSVSSDIEVRKEGNVEAAPVTECSSSEKLSGWESTDTDAPGG